MELLHYRFHLHDSATPQINGLDSYHQSLLAVHFRLSYFLRPELLPFHTCSAVLLLPGDLLCFTGAARIRDLLCRLGVTGGLREVLARQVFGTVWGVSCDASYVGVRGLSMGVDVCVALPCDDVELGLREEYEGEEDEFCDVF